MTPHEEKYQRLAEKLGIPELTALLPVPASRIRAALATGDKHLNTIPLESWDRAAGMTPWPKSHWRGRDWPGNELRYTARREPWSRAPGLSLAERVCVLKHVAVLTAQREV